MLLDRRLLAKIISFRDTRLGNTWFMVYYLLLNYITAKKIEILNLTITKTTCITRKSTKNYILDI